ncbi:UNVERIFIED_CONTAM: hypothetical protein Sangu_2706600 [Sesamum angustifolium]|uniref:DUF4218 domain-containing protein n=1 Tax=Sesamum angustifolium TaxID=2727405 RepID=A0AAW2J066_9LAMI
MEHLIIHLLYEARLGGLVQYRWIYPFERFLRELKKKVKKKAYVKASIVEAYIVDEIDLFTPQYFEPDVQSKRSMLQRNDQCTSSDDGIQVSIFNDPGRASGATKKRWISGQKRHIIETYILTNYEVVTLYYESYLNELYQHHHPDDPIIDLLVSTKFKDWFNDITSIFHEVPSMKRDKADWMAVCKEKVQRVVGDSNWTETVAYPPEEVLPVPVVATDNQSYDLRDPNGL